MYLCLGVNVVWCVMVYVCDVVCDISDELCMCLWCVYVDGIAWCVYVFV